MKNSGISWTDHSFNPWWGCEKVSPACDSCYAETFAKRVGKRVWGKDAPRRFFGVKHWSEPLKWDQAAAKAGKPALVFCASMADVFEARSDLDPWRAKLWELIEKTPNLRWVLLTKRPENILRMQPSAWVEFPPRNVWHGTTAENQRRADERIPILLQVPSRVRWISAEPLLEMIDFRTYFHGIEWIITGGESGARARRMASRWAHDIRQQCADAGVKYHFKQTGAVLARELKLKNIAGKDASEWPGSLRVQEFPLEAMR